MWAAQILSTSKNTARVEDDKKRRTSGESSMVPGQDKAMCLANTYLHTHTCTWEHLFMHAHSNPPAPELANKQKSPLHTHTHTDIIVIVPALMHSGAQLEARNREKKQKWDVIGQSSVQTRLICILRGLEVNMHERIKRYASEQTTRSLWITVPTSESFIFFLACNQADLVSAQWRFAHNGLDLLKRC